MTASSAPTPNLHGMLDVGDGQEIYWEEWGNPDGIPAVYLHGGPGGTLGKSGYRNRFDLDKARVIGFEQRGTGRSTPHASDPNVSLETNTTAHLIHDIETLQRDRDIEAWIVNGVSWGSTLGIAYTQAHPDRVLGIVLMAVTTSSRLEVDWITETVGALYPEAWDRFASFAEKAGIGYKRHQGRLVEAYSTLLNSPDAEVRSAASMEWAHWEDAHIAIGFGGFRADPRWQDERFRLSFTRLAAHYWANDGFCEPSLLDHMDRIRDIPAYLIHGRLDVSGPAITAWEVQRAWGNNAKLIIDENEGHGGRSMVGEVVRANEELVTRFARSPR